VRRALLLLPWAAVAALASCASPEEGVRAAVASNFAETHEALAAAFTDRTGIPVRTSVGSTGQLHAQIVNGAPFDVFLAADSERPRRLEEQGFTVPGSRFTYALGRLALHSTTLDSVRAGGGDLRLPDATVAMANPRTAPYGAAALEVLEALGAVGGGRLVQAENLAQVHQFVTTGAVDLGFVGLSQVRAAPPSTVWIVPDSLHDPIVQHAVLLAGSGPAARSYFEFLRSADARRIIEAAGYRVAP
jgi:molybdate transport system substrate-binding protein